MKEPNNFAVFNFKTAVGDQFDPACGFSKNASSKERVKPWFLKPDF